MTSSNMQRFLGKVALITGSTVGIGFSIAERLAKEGAKVVICSRKAENVKEAEKKLLDKGYDVKGIVCHISNSEDREKLFEAAKNFGGLDIFVQNAGVNPSYEGVLDCPISVWDKIFDVNVRSSFLLSQEALPMLMKSKAGRIIYISTVSGFFYMHNLGAYIVSKTALMALSKMAAMQLGKHNITVNCVAPGLIDTKFSKILIPDEKSVDYFKSEIFLQRFGKPEDISNIVTFLASDEANFITGETITVSGGMNTRL